MNIRILLLPLLVVAAAACGRLTPGETRCESNERRLRGRCVAIPTTPLPSRDAGFPDAQTSGGVATVEETVIQFGARVLGSRSEEVIRLRNSTGTEAVVTVVDINDGAYRLAVGSIGDQVIVPASATAEIPIEFVPSAAGPVPAQLTLDLCDAGCTVIVVLSGTGVVEPIECPDPSDLGSVAAGTCGEGIVVCSSVVDDSVTIDEATIVPAGSEFRLLTNTPFSVNRGQDVGFPIQFCPQFEGDTQSVLRLTATSAGVTRSFEPARIQGEGRRASECSLQIADTLDFGGVAPMTEVSNTIRVENTGVLPCGLTVLGIDGGQGTFQVLAPPEGQQVLVPAGRTLNITVSFMPRAQTRYEGTLAYETNDPRNPRGEVELLGTGLTDRTYDVTIRTGAAFNPLLGATVTWQGSTDDGFADVTLPFTFEFLGQATRIVRISTNGFITFANQGGTEFQNQVLPNGLPPNALVAFWWDDLDLGRPAAPGRVTTRTSNTNGQTVFHIAFIALASLSGAPDQVSGEIRLYDNTNVIEVQYGQYVDSPGLDQFRASAGWEGFNGVRGLDYLGCGASCRGVDFPANTIVTLTPATL